LEGPIGGPIWRYPWCYMYGTPSGRHGLPYTSGIMVVSIVSTGVP